jgi:Rha family phage regulatory protein
MTPKIVPIDGRLWVTSREISEKFGKQHNNVLAKIDKMECSDEFRQLNFKLSEYESPQGKDIKQYLMTRDGFTFLIMGFTGKKAAHWREQFIFAFNAMEQQLSTGRDRALDIHEYSTDLEEHTQFLRENLAVLTQMTGRHQNELIEQGGKLEEHEVRLCDLEIKVEKRVQLADKTKANHVLVVRDFYNGLCPACQENNVLTYSGRKLTTAEYDHFFSRANRDTKHTWLICSVCHSKFTRKTWSRSQKRIVFDAYQERVEQFLRKTLGNGSLQRDLFKGEG